MLKYKFDALSALKAKGYTTHLIRKGKLFSEATLQKFRHGEVIGADNLDRLCRLLDCQPGDILEYIPDTKQQAD